MGHPADHPLRIRPELPRRDPASRRLSDPARAHPGAHGPDALRLERHLLPRHGLSRRARRSSTSPSTSPCTAATRPRSPPVEACLRVIEEPVLRLTSVDLGCTAEITSLNEVFDFAKDYLGLLKAAVIASGIVPPGIEGSGQSLADLLAQRRRSGPGPRTGQQRQRHPQGLTPRRLHQSARARSSASACAPPARPRSLTGPLAESERRIVARPRHARRVDRRLRRRLAGLRRRLARHQADRRAPSPARAIPNTASPAAA